MGSSTKKKETRQPAKLEKAGASPTATRAKGLNELLVPLVNLRVGVFAKIRGTERVKVLDLGSRMDVVVTGVVLGEIAPDYELPVRQSNFKHGKVHSIEREPRAVTVLLSS